MLFNTILQIGNNSSLVNKRNVYMTPSGSTERGPSSSSERENPSDKVEQGQTSEQFRNLNLYIDRLQARFNKLFGIDEEMIKGVRLENGNVVISSSVQANLDRKLPELAKKMGADENYIRGEWMRLFNVYAKFNDLKERFDNLTKAERTALRESMERIEAAVMQGGRRVLQPNFEKNTEGVSPSEALITTMGIVQNLGYLNMARRGENRVVKLSDLTNEKLIKDQIIVYALQKKGFSIRLNSKGEVLNELGEEVPRKSDGPRVDFLPSTDGTALNIRFKYPNGDVHQVLVDVQGVGVDSINRKEWVESNSTIKVETISDGDFAKFKNSYLSEISLLADREPGNKISFEVVNYRPQTDEEVKMKVDVTKMSYLEGDKSYKVEWSEMINGQWKKTNSAEMSFSKLEGFIQSFEDSKAGILSVSEFQKSESKEQYASLFEAYRSLINSLDSIGAELQFPNFLIEAAKTTIAKRGEAITNENIKKELDRQQVLREQKKENVLRNLALLLQRFGLPKDNEQAKLVINNIRNWDGVTYDPRKRQIVVNVNSEDFSIIENINRPV